MKTNLSICALALGLVGVVLGIPQNASAQCRVSFPKKLAGASWWMNGGSSRFLPIAFQQGSDERDDRGGFKPSIVGFWHVTFTAKTMNGVAISDSVIDNALVVWHSDGTEIMNSGRPPQDGNFCMGVWKQEGESTYRLNHFAWGSNQYNPGTPNGVVGDPQGPVQYTESVRVDREAKTYSGTFTLKAYDTSGHLGTTFTGVISASRITVDTNISDLL